MVAKMAPCRSCISPLMFALPVEPTRAEWVIAMENADAAA